MLIISKLIFKIGLGIAGGMIKMDDTTLLFIYSIACIATAIEDLIIGPIAYKLNRTNLTARFLFLCIAVSACCLGLGLEALSENKETALFFSRFAWFGIVFIPSTYLHFCAAAVNLVKDKIKVIYLGYVISAIFLILNSFGGIISTVSPKFVFKNYDNAGIFLPFFLLYFFMYVGYGLYLLFKTFLNVRGYERTKIIYILAGSIIGFSGGSAAFLPVYNICYQAAFGMCISWIYPLIFAYSIVTVQLMDIEIFIHRTTRALVGIVAFFAILYITYFTFQGFFQNWLGTYWFMVPALVFGIGLLCLVFFVKHTFRMNEEDLSSKFAYRPILEKLTKRTARSTSMVELLAFTTRFISAYARLDYIGIFLLDKNKEYYELVRSLSRTSARKKIPRGLKIGSDNPIISYLKKNYTTINLSWVDFELKKTTLPIQQKEELVSVGNEMKRWAVELCIPCRSEEVLLGILLLGGKRNKEMFLPKDEDLFLTLAETIAKPIHNFFHKKEAIEGFIKSQDVIIRAVEAKDPYTRGHSERVAEISCLVGKRLGLNETQLQFLRYAARLHDIGKIAIKDKILDKEGGLTPEEHEDVKKHPQESVKMIQPIASQLGTDVIEGILHHHENIDGSGYPDNLKSDDINIFAKIIRVADTLDALATNRPYRQYPSSMKEIIEEFNRCSGKLFDCEVTQKLIELCKDKIFIDWLKEIIKNTGATSRI